MGVEDDASTSGGVTYANGHIYGAPETLDPADKHGERATVFFPGGAKYKGQWAKNRKHGKGSYTFADGDVYEGEWADDRRTGFGTYWRLDEGRYRVEYNGTWVENKKHGFGGFFNAKGERYEGEWFEGKLHGKGKQTYGGRFDGLGADVYDGEWVHGKRTGRGVMSWANGDAYEGQWEDDQKHGAGTHYYEEKRARYDGVWERDTPRCGEYRAMDDGIAPVIPLPDVKLMDADEVARRAKEVAIDALR